MRSGGLGNFIIHFLLSYPPHHLKPSKEGFFFCNRVGYPDILSYIHDIEK